MRRAALAVLLFFTAALASPAPQPSESDEPHTSQQWGTITMFHGLPSPNVRAIAQDTEGMLWFGTDGGLVRYDGLRLERIALGGPSPSVRALAVDAKGNLWAGTDAGAFVRRAQVFLPVPTTADHPVTAILPEASGAVHLASERGTIFTAAIDADRHIVVTSYGPERAPLLRRADGEPLPLAALGRRDATLLVGTHGRALLLAESGRVSEPPDPDRPFFVNAIAGDASGRLWVGADTSAGGRGLFVLDRTKTRALDVPTGSVSALCANGRGRLWIGSRDRGLFEVRDDRAVSHITTETSGGALPSNHVFAVFVDRDGVVWIGTERGICRYDPGAPAVQQLGATPSGNFIHALLVAKDGRLWAGTQRGLFVQDVGRRTWRAALNFGARTTVYALAETADGRLLAGTPGGLYLGGNSGTRWTLIRSADAGMGSSAESVRAVRVFKGAAYLATYGRGLERLDGTERVTLWPAAGDDRARRDVVSLSVADEALWIGTAAAGVFVRRGDQVTRDDSLSALGTVWSVVASADGALWIGADRGLYRRLHDRLDAIVTGQEIRDVLVDDEDPPRVWCATARSGLLKVTYDSGTDIVTSRLATDYGLPSNSVYTMALTENNGSQTATLLIGTNRGLALYEPGRTPPGLRLIRVLGRRPYAPEEWPALHLEYPQNSLLVEMAAIGSRTYPEHFQYVFTLTDASGRTLRTRLSHEGQLATDSLPPGAYCLQARAFDVDLRSSAPLSLCFDVAKAPMPWTSIGLAALLAGALLALTWGYRQNRRLVAANVALSETRRQLVQETENERRRIARDLHDQTLADLRNLLLQAEPYRAAVESISTEVRRICEDLSPSVLANVGLAPALEWALEESVRHLPPERACRTTFSCSGDLAEQLSLDGTAEIQIYRIVQEVLSNVARHARATEVRLAITVSPDGALEITVEDNGGGFDERRARTGRGLTNVRSRASLVAAEVEWRGRTGGGTVFRLCRERDQ